jgi:hypothetical protein
VKDGVNLFATGLTVPGTQSVGIGLVVGVHGDFSSTWFHYGGSVIGFQVLNFFPSFKQKILFFILGCLGLRKGNGMGNSFFPAFFNKSSYFVALKASTIVSHLIFLTLDLKVWCMNSCSILYIHDTHSCSTPSILLFHSS